MKATARIEMRCEEREKELLNRAAALKGMRTTAFIRELALEQARYVIDQAERVELNERSYRQVLDLLDQAGVIASPAERGEAISSEILRHFQCLRINSAK